MNEVREILGYYKRFLWLLFIPLGYVAVKIWYVPITNDEAYSWQLVQQQYLKAMVGTANTHWLNTACIFLGSFFGKHLLFIRWHCWLFYVMYVLGIVALAKQNFTNKYSQFLFILVASFHPYITDYACLARGYIIAMAGVVWLLHQYIKSSFFSWRTAVYTWLALLGNFSSLFIVVTVLLLYTKNSIQRRYTQALLPLISTAFLVMLVGLQLLFIGFKEDLVVGGFNNFISNTLYSFVYDGLYLPTQMNFDGGKLAAWLPYAACIGLLFFVKYGNEAVKKISVVLVLVIVLTTIACWLGKVPFAMQRAALVYWPLLLLWMLLLAEQYLQKLPSFFMLGIYTTCGVFFAGIVLPRSSFKSCKDWLPDAAMPAVLADIAFLKNENSATSIAINHVQFGTWQNYYRYLPKYSKIEGVEMVDFSGYPALKDSVSKKLHSYQFVYLCNRMPVLQYPFTYQEVKPIGSLGDSRLRLY